jgi:hypothetical protein
MKVKWHDFSRRRKIKIENFYHMSYDEYSQWCATRSVEPISRDAFPQKEELEAIVEIPSKENILVVIHKALSSKSLSKMKKTDIQSLCDTNDVDYTVQTTKKQLIQKLLELNNS